MDPEAWTFDFSGGHLAIDFANTVSGRHTPAPIERLRAYDDLVAFALQAHLITAPEERRLRAWAAGNPDRAAAIHARGLRLRDALYNLFSAVAQGKRPNAADLIQLNEGVSSMRVGDRLEWTWQSGSDAPDAMLLPVLLAALELLLSDRRSRVRICAADDCMWIFLDSSKNNSRRWCSMNQCGNRAKTRRFYARQRGARTGQ
jgi:predicted RNA-binding Zn ribbon-like protein